MSKRLQVVVEEEDLERYARSAHAAGMTLSEWARHALRASARQGSTGDVEAKLAAIRRAVSYETGGREVDVETMLAQAEAGRLAEIEAGMTGLDEG